MSRAVDCFCNEHLHGGFLFVGCTLRVLFCKWGKQPTCSTTGQLCRRCPQQPSAPTCARISRHRSSCGSWRTSSSSAPSAALKSLLAYASAAAACSSCCRGEGGEAAAAAGGSGTRAAAAKLAAEAIHARLLVSHCDWLVGSSVCCGSDGTDAAANGRSACRDALCRLRSAFGASFKLFSRAVGASATIARC